MATNPWITVGVLALAVAVVSITATKAKVSKPLRDRIKSRNAWVGELVSCPYCFSHWLALGAVIIYRPVLVSSGFLPLDLVVAAMAMVAASSLAIGLIFLALSYVPE